MSDVGFNHSISDCQQSDASLVDIVRKLRCNSLPGSIGKSASRNARRNRRLSALVDNGFDTLKQNTQTEATTNLEPDLHHTVFSDESSENSHAPPTDCNVSPKNDTAFPTNFNATPTNDNASPDLQMAFILKANSSATPSELYSFPPKESSESVQCCDCGTTGHAEITNNISACDEINSRSNSSTGHLENEYVTGNEVSGCEGVELSNEVLTCYQNIPENNCLGDYAIREIEVDAEGQPTHLPEASEEKDSEDNSDGPGGITEGNPGDPGYVEIQEEIKCVVIDEDLFNHFIDLEELEMDEDRAMFISTEPANESKDDNTYDRSGQAHEHTTTQNDIPIRPISVELAEIPADHVYLTITDDDVELYNHADPSTDTSTDCDLHPTDEPSKDSATCTDEEISDRTFEKKKWCVDVGWYSNVYDKNNIDVDTFIRIRRFSREEKVKKIENLFKRVVFLLQRYDEDGGKDGCGGVDDGDGGCGNGNCGGISGSNENETVVEIL